MTWDHSPRFRIKSRLAPEVPRVRESEIKSESAAPRVPGGYLASLAMAGRRSAWSDQRQIANFQKRQVRLIVLDLDPLGGAIVTC